MPKTESGLTQKQERFADGVAGHGNGSQAARDAGYSEASATAISTENLSKPSVLARVRQKSAEYARDADLKAQDVIDGLLKIIDEDSDPKTATARVQALHHLGRYFGMFVDRHEVLHRDMTHEDMLANLTVDELRQLLPIVADKEATALPAPTLIDPAEPV